MKPPRWECRQWTRRVENKAGHWGETWTTLRRPAVCSELSPQCNPFHTAENIQSGSFYFRKRSCTRIKIRSGHPPQASFWNGTDTLKEMQMTITFTTTELKRMLEGLGRGVSMQDHNSKTGYQNMNTQRWKMKLKMKGKAVKLIRECTNEGASVSKVLVTGSCIRNAYPLAKFT